MLIGNEESLEITTTVPLMRFPKNIALTLFLEDNINILEENERPLVLVLCSNGWSRSPLRYCWFKEV